MKNLCIEMWPVEKLIPYPNAIRKNDHAVRRMISLIQEFGFKLPLLIRGGGEIVDGHLRWKAAKKLELAESAPRTATCREVTGRDKFVRTLLAPQRFRSNRSPENSGGFYRLYI